jgi:hypothetical protein
MSLYGIPSTFSLSVEGLQNLFSPPVSLKTQPFQVGVIEASSLRLGDPKVDLPTGAGLMLDDPDYDWVTSLFL